MKFADLHLHTVFSDGTYTPPSLVSECQRHGLSAISVTDHDTVKGIIAVTEIAKDKDIEVLPGIELTAEYEGREIHILGYLIDRENESLLKRLEILRENRIERAYKIIDKLKGLGVILKPEAVFELAKQGTMGRLHIARAMVKERITSSILEAFQKYIGDKCPAYVLDFKLSAEEAIKLIADSGGISVLAHPYTLNNDEVILKFIDYGLMGLEAYYPEHSQAMVNFYLDLAKKHNLLVTGGSDSHGEAKLQTKIGSIKIPYNLVEKLKIAKDNRR
ncbi:MAG: PHP domain-containing protein [Candidatus Omnitrophica bacterium]|nr:PHP domain-containing protein [Candidatus Omnitrophota bacterium]